MKKISIIIPAYNEASFIEELLYRVEAVSLSSEGFDKQTYDNYEIIIVDDGSTDSTADLAEKHSSVLVIRKENGGKGSAVQAGIKNATGDWILIQDADLEYNPDDYIPIVRSLNKYGDKTAVYGSRFLGQIREHGFCRVFPGKHPLQGLGPWFMNIILCLESFILFGKIITDNLTGYKLYPAMLLKQHSFVTSGFEGDHEITCLLLRKGYAIQEVPIQYTPRTQEEGKKIRMRDGFIALWTFVRCRFARGKAWQS